MRIHLGTDAGRFPRKGGRRIPRWLRPILEVPLELKLLGANLTIVGLALLLMFGPVQFELSRLADAYIVVTVLLLGAAVNFVLVRVALAPLRSIERVARWVSQGRFGERVPVSLVADHELARVSRTINEMLDTLAADRKRIEALGAELDSEAAEQGWHASRRWRDRSAAGISHEVFNAADSG